jgi:hypothetical protein
MSEKKSKTALLEELWRSVLDGNPVMPENAGEESENFYLNKIIETLVQYGGIQGMALVNGVSLPSEADTQAVLTNFIERNTRNLAF